MKIKVTSMPDSKNDCPFYSLNGKQNMCIDGCKCNFKVHISDFDDGYGENKIITCHLLRD